MKNNLENARGKEPAAGYEEDLGIKVAKYRQLTRLALEKVELNSAKGTKENIMGKKLLEMAESYFMDAQYFEQSGKPLTALAAYSYAHAWIDAGVRLGILDGKGDDQLFVLP
ncbi:MAG TPA: DUF357 domain-containing protein [archaeon]|nr:DUF357 domain-containing protein [archaeon]